MRHSEKPGVSWLRCFTRSTEGVDAEPQEGVQPSGRKTQGMQVGVAERKPQPHRLAGEMTDILATLPANRIVDPIAKHTTVCFREADWQQRPLRLKVQSDLASWMSCSMSKCSSRPKQ